MLGFNGGVIGARNETSANLSVPGVWTLREQLEAKRLRLWPGTVRPDDSFGSVVLLLPCNGVDNSTEIIDYSSSNKAVTAVGNASVTINSSKYYGSSVVLDGTRDFLRIEASDDFAFGTGNYTVEAWVRGGVQIDGYPRLVHFGSTATGTGIHAILFDENDNNGKISYFVNGISGRALVSTSTVTTNTFLHVAVTRSSGVFRLFINGSLEATNSANTSFNLGATPLPCLIGSVITEVSGEDFGGNYNDIRITKGVARYTANFTPPDSFLL